MKSIFLVAPIALATAAPVLVSFARSADDKQRSTHMDESPSAEIARMAKFAGDYAITITASLGEGKQLVSKGRATLTPILGGRFVEQRDTGEMFGAPFEALHLWGFNAAAKRYEATWVYTGSTALMSLTGASHDDGQHVTFDATYATGGATSPLFTITYEEIDAQSFKLTLAAKEGQTGPGAGTTLEKLYKRVK